MTDQSKPGAINFEPPPIPPITRKGFNKEGTSPRKGGLNPNPIPNKRPDPKAQSAAIGWNFVMDSQKAIPKIFKDGKELKFADGYGIIDFKAHWHTNDERGINKTKWQALFVKVDEATSMPDAVEHYFIEGIGDYAEINTVPSNIETCAEAEEYRKGLDKPRGLTMHLNLDCSDALRGLKAVQREARSTAQALKEVSGTEVDMRVRASALAYPKLLTKELGVIEAQLINTVNALRKPGEQ